MLSSREVKHFISDVVPWRRRPEPLGHLEGAQEYQGFADTAFATSDRLLAEQLADIIPGDFTGPIIDLGSGPGAIANHLSEILATQQRENVIICFDYSQEMLALARNRRVQSETEAKKLKLPLGPMEFVQGSFTDAVSNLPITNAFVISNTAFHELRTRKDLRDTFKNLAMLVGENGGCHIRDLALPFNARQARRWRAEVINDSQLDPRELQLFVNSQHAAFRQLTLSRAISLAGLNGNLRKGSADNQTSRYWTFAIKPKQSNQFQSLPGGRR